MKKFKHLVYAGTFDRLHIGHKKMLDLAFSLAENVSIGITTEKLYQLKPLANLITTEAVRRRAVEQYVGERKWQKRVKFFRIEDIYGPSITDPSMDSILVTELTKKNAEKINEIRVRSYELGGKRKLKSLKIIVAPLVKGEDGEAVTSERIRMGEIDHFGHNFQFSILNFQRKKLILPKYLRKELRKPLGKVIKSQIPTHKKQTLKQNKFASGQVNFKFEIPNNQVLRQTAKRTLQHVNKLKQKVMIISIGDVITESLFDVGFEPDIKIIDLRSRRQNIVEILNIKNQISKLHIKNQIFKEVNQPGTINIKTAEEIEKRIKQFILKGEKSWVVIDGEEDLLALPAILFAPLGSVVLYGQMDLGVILVEVSEEKKREVEGILRKFN